MTPATSVTRARGYHLRPYVVAQFRGERMRIAHLPDLAEANQVRGEWERGDFSFHPGEVRHLGSLN